MKKIWMGGLLTLCLVAAPSFAVHAGDSDTSSQDRKFIRAASEAGMRVERMSQLANEETANPGVKQVTEKLSRDYIRADEKLRATSQSLDISAPSKLSSRSARELDRLEGISGAEFDQVALKELVRAEQAYLLNIQDEAAKGSNPELKQFASSILPPLQDDIYQVVLLQSDLNVTASTTTGNSAGANTGQALADRQ
jgi:putative membrane protein